MEIAKKIAKPENWQDFESLCKKLWGEIRNCSEIKKNGRQGQLQKGIDIYGIPKGEKEYFGIQCKGKDDYIKAKLTEKEIDDEIKKALSFEPKLKKVYFATTANKDVKIEEYIRKKNIENINKNLFEVHIYSWEDIVDLIEENEKTYNFYIKSINFRNKNNISISFDNGKSEIEKEVLFEKKKLVYKYKYKTELEKQMEKVANQHSKFLESIKYSPYFGENKGENFSKFNFPIVLKNSGDISLENYKIHLEFFGEIDCIYDNRPMFPIKDRYTDCYIFEDENSGTLKEPNDKPLVPQDSHVFDTIYIIPIYNCKNIKLKWSFLSKNYNTNGELNIKVKSKIIETEEVIFVYTKNEEKEEMSDVQNFYLTEERENQLKKGNDDLLKLDFGK